MDIQIWLIQGKKCLGLKKQQKNQKMSFSVFTSGNLEFKDLILNKSVVHKG